MNNNQAFVVHLGNIRPIEGADNIVVASVILDGIEVTNVVVGKDVRDGKKGVYFDANMMLEATTIIADYPDLAKYLTKTLRVRTIKLRGTYSDGLFVEIDKFFKYDKKANEWAEGYAFTHIGNKKICEKYTRPIRVNDNNKQGKGAKTKHESRMIEGQFRFHIDTDQLPRNIYRIKPDDVISISRKFHGTSAIVSNCLVKKKLTFFQRILKKIGFPIVDSEYDYIYSSRSVIKNGNTNTGFYHTDIWTSAGRQFEDRLHQGETIYFEIVGFTDNGKCIQKNYNYGCAPNKNKILVYRITKTALDGSVCEYGWQAMKERCVELGVEHVTEFYFGRAADLFTIETNEEWSNNFLQKLKETFLEKKVNENIGKKVPDEGIVLRKEAIGIQAFKLKSLSFIEGEVKASEEEDNENMEEEG